MRRLGSFARDVIVPALFACWIAYLAYGAFAGAAGFRVLRDLNIELDARRAEVAELEARRAALEKRADLLNPKSLDPDMIDERIRAVLGFAREGDIVIPKSEFERLSAPRANGD
jgi:cell division protein FtsB